VYSCTRVLVYSCTRVLVYSCTRVLVYSCTRVLVYSSPSNDLPSLHFPTATNGCPTCKRIWALLQIHARQCRIINHCPVPRCRDLKAHLRRMRMDQRERDNRRRQAFETGKWWSGWSGWSGWVGYLKEWVVR
jgi:hypothetical protein